MIRPATPLLGQSAIVSLKTVASIAAALKVLDARSRFAGVVLEQSI
jgi:hypothetical protein